MPTRLIKESVCLSDTINELSWFEEVTFYRLLTVCDDFGRMDARPKILKGRMFPLKDNLRVGEISQALDKLESVGLIRQYLADDGKPYLQVVTWEHHQNVRTKKSKYPEPADICMQMNTDEYKCSRNPNPNPNPNPDPKENERARRFVPPSVDEVAAYCRERGNGIDPDQFVNFYESKGWKVGNSPMKDWRAAVRTWEQRDKTGGKTVAAQKYGQRDYDEAELEEKLGVNELFKAEG